MAGVVGRAFKIKKNQTKSYGYAKPNRAKPGKFRRNPGVTTIAAINGRGSYRSARASMRGLSPNARLKRARTQLSNSEKQAFKARMDAARLKKNRARAGGRLVRKNSVVTRKRMAARSPISPRRVRRNKSPGVYAANTRKTMKRKKRKSPVRRRKSSKRRRKVSAAAKSPVRRRKRRKKARAKAAAPKRRKRRRKAKALKANPRRRRRRKKAAAKAPVRRRRRKRKARRASARGRKTSKKRRRKTRAKLKANGRRRRKARKNAAPRRRRRVRRNSARRSMSSNKRRRKARKNKGRRRARRNGRRSAFRRNNGVMGFLKMGGMLLLGFGAHRLVTNVLDKQVLSRLLPAPTPTPQPTSGLDALSKFSKPIAALGAAALGVFIVNKTVKDDSTKKLMIGGIAVSTLHGVVMSLLDAFVPQAASMLAGPESGTAARLSAMYGLGHGASIMPRYAPINGMGEYFAQPTNGLGEYFSQPMSGMGEYLAVQGMQGLGTYQRNPELMEAAAGMGAVVETQGSHIDPSSDLDRQLTIAEAAAGVGAVSPFEAAAGLQPFEASAGMGAVVTVPSSDTWIPGTSDPQLWAGVRPVNRPQSATEMVPAGILQTEGGQGIFG